MTRFVFFAVVMQGLLCTAQTPTVLPPGTVGQPYSSGPLVGSICPSPSTLPPGLSCSLIGVSTSTTIVIAGTPTQSGTYRFSAGNFLYSLTINPAVTSPFIPSTPTVNFTATSSRLPQTVSIRIDTVNNVSTPFVAGVAYAATPPTPWLAVSPTSGIAPITMSATVNPARLSAGTYRAAININLPPSAQAAFRQAEPFADTTATITVTLTVPPEGLNFYFVLNGPKPSSKGLTVDPAGAANAQVSAFAAVNTPSGVNWLSVTPANATAPTILTVAVDPAGLGPGNYTGTVSVFVVPGQTGSGVVPVTLTVLDSAGATINFSYQVGGAAPAAQTLDLFAQSAAALNFITDVSSEGGAWLTVLPASGVLSPNALTTITFTVAAGQPAGVYRAICAFIDPANPTAANVALVVLTVSGGVSRQIISHLADGDGWKTTIILVNLDTVAAQFTVNFWRDDGTAYPMPLAGQGTRTSVADTIPVGGSRTIESSGTGVLTQGWAEVLSSQNISGTAIFRAQNIGQEAAVPLLASGSTRLLLPYDTSPGLALGVGLANASTLDGSVSLVWRNQQGQSISTERRPLAANNHTAFVIDNPSRQAADQRGVIEFNSAADIFALGIRASGGAFTSIESLGRESKGNRTISHIANGENWKTTIILVNTDSVAATFTLNFFKQDGSPMTVSIAGRGNVSSVTDTIPVAGSRTIETDGLAPELTLGWAQVTTAEAISGTAIFRAQNIGQEAAVPLLTAGRARLLLPFDTNSGLALGIAVANPSPISDVSVTVTIRNQQGQLIDTSRVTVRARGHTSFVLSNPSSLPADQRGVVELSAPGSQIFALGIRANQGAFTSIRALGN